MSWASRRRTSYALGVAVFFLVVVGGPVAHWYFTIPPTCTDGIQNQKETSIDKGGPCPLLDVHSLSPSAILWARSFRVRDGSYNAVAYLQNPNKDAGVRSVSYRFGLYDEKNILVAERTGTTYIMPGAVTPVFEGAIDTGNRVVAHTYFEFQSSLAWERLLNSATVLSVSDTHVSDTATSPRVTARVTNTSVADVSNIKFVAAIFDPAGNAFASSQTALSELKSGETQDIIFTWPDPFNITVGRVDITPISAPTAER